jgi:hypothetical protein
MLTHDYAAPIRPGTLRISIIADDERFAVDFSTGCLAGTLTAFAEYAGIDMFDEPTPQAVQRSKEMVAAAMEDGDAYVIAVGALWLFLKPPGAESGMYNDALTRMIAENGACLLTAAVNQRAGGVWDFRLYAVPHWPVARVPQGKTPEERQQRQWR